MDKAAGDYKDRMNKAAAIKAEIDRNIDIMPIYFVGFKRFVCLLIRIKLQDVF